MSLGWWELVVVIDRIEFVLGCFGYVGFDCFVVYLLDGCVCG